MSVPQPFRASIAVPLNDRGRLITDRVACHQRINTLREDPHGILDHERKQQYRDNLITLFRHAWAGRSDADQLMDSFLSLAETLKVVNALAVHTASDKIDSMEGCSGKDDTVTSASNVSRAADDALIGGHAINNSLCHPLLLALLAFRAGGVVNAADTTHLHQWQPPSVSTDSAAKFHVEGDSKDIFDEYRITLVWESHNDNLTVPSGKHSVFKRGAATPRPLNIISAKDQQQPCTPLTIVYRPRRAALYYDSCGSEATRQSISLDFHVNRIPNDEFELFDRPRLAPSQLEELTLASLVARFPIYDYADHFHRLLFEGRALDELVSMLAELSIPHRTLQPIASHGASLQHRYRKWLQENQASIPPAVLSLRHDVPMAGVYDVSSAFVQNSCTKARRDVHLSIGMDMIPQSPIDARREYARKYIRDQPAGLVHEKLVQYAKVLTTQPYMSADLISTSSLRGIGYRIEVTCSELVGVGFVDKASLLPAIGSLASKLGAVLDGTKEVSVSAEPWVTDGDLQVFRTRCLYLFWCADWLARYLASPEKGTLMIRDVSENEMIEMREEATRVARWLLRNWVAWGLFVEELPIGGFTVRRALEFAV